MRTDNGPRRTGAGRPMGPQPAKRQAILEAAVAVFLREGYTRAGVDVIADEAGVSKQTVYNHFGDKERLFIAAVEGERERVAAAFADGAPYAPEQFDGDARAVLIAFGHRVLEVLLDERASALRRLVIAEVARHPSLRTACSDGEPQRLVVWLTGMLDRRTVSGELSVPDPASAAQQFVALLVQQGLYQSMYGTRPLAAEIAASICEKAADLFVRAYRT
ncbi:TetR/AcrR family transcriptional regulator [Streptomyces coffeae]|uniref:TetR/AcrR family transcriptional regulator n=1 Tax=Streptomyces coffeae TaxID=621382 RepID=A0ABS1N7C4_9ACTN|nr:TetR/AcrR family transcriptional regulator [Streptomyces coffeae]MBL1095771.1 TetR/AcrR family transcriptional regulator [Streptomyces coffeae]